MAVPAFKKLKVLILYKRSSFLATKRLPASAGPTADRFRQNHIHHYESLRKVESVLKDEGLSYRKHCRSRTVNYRPFNLVITVGGDGTFLDAARKLTKTQYILGVNSDPQWSVGRFCACDATGFKRILHRILDRKFSIKRLYRLRLALSGMKNPIECLNDVLICHPNPAAMSRYSIRIKIECEEHRSSGIWFSTASGSTGAILSAGGKKMNLESRAIQYKPRELYQIPGRAYHLKGGIMPPPSQAIVTSRMPRGNVFIDGAHISFPFPYGTRATVSISPNFVNLIHA